MTHHVIVAIGSNYHQAAHLHWVCQRLPLMLSNTRFSPVMWTPDHHHSGRYYMNQLLSGTTMHSPDDLIAALKDIEVESRRTSEKVTLDLDLMLYDDVRYHLNDWPRPYIQQLIPTLR